MTTQHNLEGIYLAVLKTFPMTKKEYVQGLIHKSNSGVGYNAEEKSKSFSGRQRHV